MSRYDHSTSSSESESMKQVSGGTSCICTLGAPCKQRIFSSTLFLLFIKRNENELEWNEDDDDDDENNSNNYINIHIIREIKLQNHLDIFKILSGIHIIVSTDHFWM